MISIKSEFEIVKVIESIPVSERTVIQKAYLKQELAEETEEEVSIHQIVESQFARLFTTYAIRFNVKYKRSGNLFHRPFKRVTVKSEDHLIWLVYYIHLNPMKHKVQRDFQNYPWSSFQIILSEKPTGLNRTAVLYLFGTVEWFEKFHQTDKDMPASTEGWHIEEE